MNFKTLIAVLVIGIHVLFLRSFEHSGSRQTLWRKSVPMDSFILAQIVAQSSESNKVPIADVKLEPVPITSVSTTIEQINDPDDEPAASTGAPASFPRLAAAQPVDIRDVARRAGIEPGRPLVVVLAVLVDTEGAVSAINIMRTCGVEAADQAAIEYARHLRWIPGTINHVPQSLRVILPVTLNSDAS